MALKSKWDVSSFCFSRSLSIWDRDNLLGDEDAIFAVSSHEYNRVV
jgi:hypothetical protein